MHRKIYARESLDFVFIGEISKISKSVEIQILNYFSKLYNNNVNLLHVCFIQFSIFILTRFISLKLITIVYTVMICFELALLNITSEIYHSTRIQPIIPNLQRLKALIKTSAVGTMQILIIYTRLCHLWNGFIEQRNTYRQAKAANNSLYAFL